MRSKRMLGLATMTLTLANAPAHAQMRITEWMYSGNSGEYIEFTNVGNSPIDMTGWSYDDDSRVAGTVSLDAYGTVAAGESVLLTEELETTLRTRWSLPASVKIIGANAANLGRNDEINLYDSLQNLVDRLTFGDQTFPGTIRTQNVSGNPMSDAALGANDVSLWQLASVGDAYGSHSSAQSDLGNPGAYPVATVPEPGSFVLAAFGVAIAMLRSCRKPVELPVCLS